MDTHTYPTDLSDAEWRVVQPLLPSEAKTGRPRQHPLRTIVDAIVYVLRAGCAWRLLPREFPPWKTVYHYFRTWRLDGTWQQVHLALRQRLRIQLGRDPEPSAGSIDSQSVKTTAVGGVRGYDGGKKLVGRKRQVLVDTEGLLIALNVHPASIMDRDGVKLLLTESVRAQLTRMRHLWLDAGYNGCGKGKDWVDWVERVTGWTVQTVKALHARKYSWVPKDIPPDQIDWSQYLPPPDFHVIPRRWVVERTFAWLSHNRRLSKDYERLCTTSEAWIYVALIRLMAKRLARL